MRKAFRWEGENRPILIEDVPYYPAPATKTQPHHHHNARPRPPHREVRPLWPAGLRGLLAGRRGATAPRFPGGDIIWATGMIARLKRCKPTEVASAGACSSRRAVPLLANRRQRPVKTKEVRALSYIPGVYPILHHTGLQLH